MKCCPICREDFARESQMYVHLAYAHQGQEKAEELVRLYMDGPEFDRIPPARSSHA